MSLKPTELLLIQGLREANITESPKLSPALDVSGLIILINYESK